MVKPSNKISRSSCLMLCVKPTMLPSMYTDFSRWADRLIDSAAKRATLMYGQVSSGDGYSSSRTSSDVSAENAKLVENGAAHIYQGRSPWRNHVVAIYIHAILSGVYLTMMILLATDNSALRLKLQRTLLYCKCWTPSLRRELLSRDPTYS